jgi:nucleoside-diphosphate-sugar epimerase
MLSEDDLDERLSRPRPELINDLQKIDGDIVVLGAAGKLGPSLVELATRGVTKAETGTTVHAVSRFSSPETAERIAATGAHVIAADITDERALADLPDAANVIYLVGAKFGTGGQEATTWAINTYLPGRVAQRYAGSRLVALSTGNVYPLWPTSSGGPSESDAVGPVGEYAMSCLGRERVLTHFAHQNGSPSALIRLNYAIEMRYGVLMDIARAIWDGEPIDLTMGHANVVWQGYANEVTLRSLLHTDTPPFVLNLTGPETVSVRAVATSLGQLLDREVTFTGTEEPTALLSNATRCHGLFGYPDMPLAELIEATAHWVHSGLPVHGKPTKFQRRDGRF